MATIWGRELINCSGRLIRSQYRVNAWNASVTVIVGFWKFSTCCNTGSGSLFANVSPDRSRIGSRLAWAVAAAVRRLVQPGPIELVATMICLLRLALAYATPAKAIDCSFCPRQVGISSRTVSRASPRQVTFPCPKMAKTPGNNASSLPSINVRWFTRKRTNACAMVSRMVFISLLKYLMSLMFRKLLNTD